MISVIMSTYAEPEHVLRASVESVLTQTYTDVEFIIVQDDPGNAVHTAVLNEYAARDSRICLIRNRQRVRQPVALNLAISRAHGAYIARMDADDISLPDRLEKELHWLEDTGADLSGCLMQVIRNDGSFLCTVKRAPFRDATIRRALRYGSCMPHPTWFGRAEVFSRTGGYRPLETAADYDFLARAALAGFRMTNLNRPVFQYRLNPNGVSKQNLYRQYLTMKYISRFYKRGLTAGEDGLRDWLSKNYSETKAAAYAHSDTLFYEALGHLEQKNFVSAFALSFRLLFLSPAFLERIVRFMILDYFAGRDRHSGKRDAV